MKRVTVGRSDMDIRRVDTHLLRARSKDDYEKTGIVRLLNTLAWGSHLILKGPKGSGKTLNVEQWAHEKEVPFLRFGCTGQTSDRELLGGFTFKSLEESWFSLGVLSAAVDVANEVGRCVLVLEEINALNEEAQKAVNSIADYRREVALPNVGVVFRLDEPITVKNAGEVIRIEQDGERVNVAVNAEKDIDEYSVPRMTIDMSLATGTKVEVGQALCTPPQLWVIGTMNPGYGGTYDLNEDFRSRFQFVDVQFMDESLERDIIHGQFPGKPTPNEKLFVRSLQSLAKESRGNKFGYALSTRDLAQCIEAYLAFRERGDRKAVEKALKLLEGKFPARHAADFQSRVRSTFKNPVIDLSKTTLY